MKNWIHSISLLFLSLNSFEIYSQVTLCLGADATICPGQGFTINDCANVGGSMGGGGGAAYNTSTIPFAPDPLTAGAQVTLTDDALSGVLDIGFSFCYYGNTYTQFNIGSNNFISFPPNANAPVLGIGVVTHVALAFLFLQMLMQHGSQHQFLIQVLFLRMLLWRHGKIFILV